MMMLCVYICDVDIPNTTNGVKLRWYTYIVPESKIDASKVRSRILSW